MTPVKANGILKTAIHFYYGNYTCFQNICFHSNETGFPMVIAGVAYRVTLYRCLDGCLNGWRGHGACPAIISPLHQLSQWLTLAYGLRRRVSSGAPICLCHGRSLLSRLYPAAPPSFLSVGDIFPGRGHNASLHRCCRTDASLYGQCQRADELLSRQTLSFLNLFKNIVIRYSYVRVCEQTTCTLGVGPLVKK